MFYFYLKNGEQCTKSHFFLLNLQSKGLLIMSYQASTTKKRYVELQRDPVLFCKYEEIDGYDDNGMYFSKVGWHSCDPTIELFISESILKENSSKRRLFVIGNQVHVNGKIDENKEDNDIVCFEVEEFESRNQGDWMAVFTDCAYNYKSNNTKYGHMSLFWALYTTTWTEDVIREAVSLIPNEDAQIGLKYIWDNLISLSLNKQKIIINLLKEKNPHITPMCFLMVEEVLKELSPEKNYDDYGFFDKIDFIINYGATEEEHSHLQELYKTSRNAFIHFKYWLNHPGHKLYDYGILETIYSFVKPNMRLNIIKRYLHDVRIRVVDIDYNFIKNFRDIRYYGLVIIRYFVEQPGANIDLVAPMFCDAILTLKKNEGKKIQDFNGILDFAVSHSNSAYPSIDLGIKQFLPSCDGGLKPNNRFNGFIHYSLTYRFDELLLTSENLKKTVEYILGKYADQQYHLCCAGENDRGLTEKDLLRCSTVIPIIVKETKDGVQTAEKKKIKCSSLVNRPWKPSRWKKKPGSDNFLGLCLSGEAINRVFTFDDIDLGKLKNSILSWAVKNNSFEFINGYLPKGLEKYDLVKHFIDLYFKPTEISLFPKKNVFYASKKSLLGLWDFETAWRKNPDEIEALALRAESPFIYQKTFDALKHMYPNGVIGSDYIRIPYDETELRRVKDYFYFKQHVLEENTSPTTKINYNNLKFLDSKSIHNTFYCTPKLADTNETVSDLPFYWCRSEECFCNMLDNQTLEKEHNWERYSLYHAAEIIGYKLIEETEKGNIPVEAVSNFAAEVRQAERLYARLICRSCGHMIFSTRGSILNGSRFFSCLNPMCAEYKKEVYLSQCNSCKRGLIDSRDSKKCENGWVICPVCLSCCNDDLFDSLIAKHRRNGYVPPRLLECEGKGHNNKHIYFCPKCATKIEEIYIDEKQQQEDGTDKIVKIKVWGCPKCKISYEKELKKQKEE